MTPKLVVLDLDGTAVPYDLDVAGRPGERLRAAVGKATAAGAIVTIATGRAIWNALPVVEELGLTDVELVSSNGAVGYDTGTGSVIFQVPFDPTDAGQRLARLLPDAGFAAERGVAGYAYTPNFLRQREWGFLRAEPLDALLAEPTTRLVCRLGGELTRDNYAERKITAKTALAAAELDPARFHIELGFAGWIDVSAAGVSKGSGVARLAERFGVSAADTAVIGDGGNDLPMFAWAGHAVAMGQAADVVKAAADEITAPVDADGAALVLERWFS